MKKKIGLSLLMLVLAFVVGCSSNKPASVSYQPKEGEYVADDFLLSDVSVDFNEIGPNIEGEVKNLGSKDYTGAVVSISFYDADKKRVARAMGSINELKSGETKTITFLTTDKFDSYSSVKFQVDSKF